MDEEGSILEVVQPHLRGRRGESIYEKPPSVDPTGIQSPVSSSSAGHSNTRDGEVRRHQEASLVTIRSSAGQWSVVSQTGRAFCAVSRVSIPGLITSYVVKSSYPPSIRCSSQVALYLTSGRSAFVGFPSIAMAKSCLRVYLPDDSKKGKRPSTTLTNLSGRPTTLTSKPKFWLVIIPGTNALHTTSFRMNRPNDKPGIKRDLQRRSDIPDLAEVLRTVKQAWPSPRSCSLDRLDIEVVNTYFRGGRVENHSGKTIPSSPERDSDLDLTILDSLSQHETSALDNYATEAGIGKVELEEVNPHLRGGRVEKPLRKNHLPVHPTEIRTSISPSSAVELNTTSAVRDTDIIDKDLKVLRTERG
uniref:(California timema) hypothetical protein n=1 Tax=Timema californicum TaxID=61474 RepID=A0A7R9IZ01_TIMCA|nr:unnamed protein product [Timema californicum]